MRKRWVSRCAIFSQRRRRPAAQRQHAAAANKDSPFYVACNTHHMQAARALSPTSKKAPLLRSASATSEEFDAVLERVRQRQPRELILALDDVRRSFKPQHTHSHALHPCCPPAAACFQCASCASPTAQAERSLLWLLPPRDTTRHRRLWLLLGNYSHFRTPTSPHSSCCHRGYSHGCGRALHCAVHRPLQPRLYRPAHRQGPSCLYSCPPPASSSLPPALVSPLISRALQDGMQSSACTELQRIALACSDQGAGDALLLQTSAWVLADMQRLTVRLCPAARATRQRR